MLSIAKQSLPTEDAKRASGEAFYVLCDNYDEWKDTQSFQEAIENLRGAHCFPAEGDSEQWHAAESLTPLTGRRHSNPRRTFSISGIRDG